MALSTFDGQDTDDTILLGLRTEKDEETLAAAFVIAITSLTILLETCIITLRIFNIGFINLNIKIFLQIVRPIVIAIHAK